MGIQLRLPQGTTPEDLKRLREVLSDFKNFHQMLAIYHKWDKCLSLFDMNDEQQELAQALNKHNRIIVIKPRQIGISTAIRAYMFYKWWTSEEPRKYGVVSYHDRSAKELRAADNVFYDNLASLLQRDLSKNNATTMEFKDTKATNSSFTAGGRRGTRSFVLTDAHLSEFAFYDDPAEMLSNILATVGDGQVIIESTANQPGDYFHDLVLGAEAGTNEWTLVTFWWWQHKRYTEPAPMNFQRTPEEAQLEVTYGTKLTDDQLQWRRTQIRLLGEREGNLKFPREYPGCIADAFNFAGTRFFDPTHIDDITAVPLIKDGDSIEWHAKPGVHPHPQDEYVAGLDISGGLEQDYSAIVIVSVTTLEPVYVFRTSHMRPEQFAEFLVEGPLTAYQPMVLCERNNYGHLVLYRLEQLQYPHIWTDEKGDYWHTNVKTKGEAFGALLHMVEARLIPALPAWLVREMRALTVPEGKVNPEAPKTKTGKQFVHDDGPVAAALAYRCFRDIPASRVNRLRKIPTMDEIIAKNRIRRTRHARNLPWRQNS